MVLPLCRQICRVPSPQSSLVHYNALYSCSLPLSLKLNLFQRLVAFMTDLRGADSLLQKAIKKVDDGRKLDAAQVGDTCSLCDVMLCAAHFGPGRTLCFCCCRKCSNALRNRGPQWKRCWKMLDWSVCKEKEGLYWPEWGERTSDSHSLRTTGITSYLSL